MEIKLLKLWISSLRAYKPDVEPEAGHFDSLIEWLEHYIEESRRTSAAPDAASDEPFPKCDACGEVWTDHVCP